MFLNTKNLFNSLKNRVLISALLMVFILVPLVGLIISDAYEKHMLSSVNNELSAYSFSILAMVEVENGALIMPEQLLNTQFNVSQSGLYAALTSSGKDQAHLTSTVNTLLWSSQSLLAPLSLENLQTPSLGKNNFYSILINNTPHFVYSLSVSYGDNDAAFPMTLHIIKDKKEMMTMLSEFHKKLLLGLAGLMGFLLLIQYLWSTWTLKPLLTLRKELLAVEQGKSDSLQQQYPTELNKVAKQLNLLLSAEQKQRLRYRNALSDLAHSLKTPLAVIQSEVGLSTQIYEQVSVLNAIVEHQLKKAQSAGQSSWHLGTPIAPVAEKLILSLKKIYHNKTISFHLNVDKNTVFKGDESDLMEIIGNLLDNACKASKGVVKLNVFNLNQQLNIIIKDDGCGIKADVRQEILQRGTRTDTYQKGHGIGLAIVRDLIDSYQGELKIENSASLKGAKFTLRFNQ